MDRMLAIVLSLVLALPGCAPRSRSLMHVGFAGSAQSPANPASATDAWRSFLGKLPPGARIKVTLKNGRNIRAMLMQVTDDAVVINPRTRVPEPVQTIAIADLAAVDLETDNPSIGKAIGIGIASGVGAFLTILVIALATLDD